MAPRYRVSCEVPTRMASRSAPASLVLLVSVFLLSGPLGHAEPVAQPIATIAQQVATIASDRTDYPPGDTVTLTGGGWTPQETVTIVLHRDPFLHPDNVLTSVADANGTITNTSFRAALDDFGVTFFVTATGSQSGLQATTTFKAAETSLDRRRLHGLEHGRQLEPVRRARRQGRHHDSGWRFKRPLSGRQLGARIRRPRDPHGRCRHAAKPHGVGRLAERRQPRGRSRNAERIRRHAPRLRRHRRLQRRHGQRLGHRPHPPGECHRQPAERQHQPLGRGDVQPVRRHGQHPEFQQPWEFNNPAAPTTSRAARSASTATSRTPGPSSRRPARSCSPAAAAGRRFNAPGTNQFFNVVVNSGVYTTSTSAVNAQIRVRGNWTMDGAAEPD